MCSFKFAQTNGGERANARDVLEQPFHSSQQVLGLEEIRAEIQRRIYFDSILINEIRKVNVSFSLSYLKVRINLIGIYDRLNQINDDNIGKVDEYDGFIHDLQLLNEQSKVSL